MLQRTGEAETITTHYLFALGAYRALYIPNWIYRYATEVPHFWDPIAVIAGVVQTILYSDFFWIYYTKCAKATPLQDCVANSSLGSFRARNSTSLCRQSGFYQRWLRTLPMELRQVAHLRMTCLHGRCRHTRTAVLSSLYDKIRGPGKEGGPGIMRWTDQWAGVGRSRSTACGIWERRVLFSPE